MRMKALEVERCVYEIIVSRRRISEALRARVLEAATEVIQSGDTVRVFREADGRQNRTYDIVSVEGKTATLKFKDKYVLLNLAQVIKAKPPLADPVLEAFLSIFEDD